MLTIGVDAHKAVHQALALDDTGSVLGSWRGATTPGHWLQLLDWVKALPGPRQWGIEGAWNYGRRLAQFLVAQRETVFEVNPRWTAERRRRARKSGKSDCLDAHAVAKLVREEGSSLPRVAAEDETAVLDLLVTDREGVLAEATRLRNQLHQLLLQVDPDYKLHLPSLTSAAGLRALMTYSVAISIPLQRQRVAAIQRLAQRLDLATEQAAALEQEICALAEAHYSEAHLAAYAGVAPLEASSAGLVRHRLNRGGNRRLNAILYRIALSQARSCAQAQAYLARRQAEGKTWREAIRALKRYLIRAVWRLWQECLAANERSSERRAALRK